MIDPDGPGFLVFSGSNDRAVLALCRGFGKYKVPFALIGRQDRDLLDRSEYGLRSLGYRTHSAPTLAGLVDAVHEANRRFGERTWVLCPTSEYLNLRFFSMKEALASNSMRLATCSVDLYMRISDKSNFRVFCSELGIAPPEIIKGVEPSSIPIPFVAKPFANLSKSGRILYPYLIKSEDDRLEFMKEMDHTEYYYEQFIEGESWYLLYHISPSGALTMGSQRNLLQQGRGRSIVMATSEDHPDPDLMVRVGKGLANAGYHGLIMVEVRRTASGATIAIEANPRCWGPFQLTLDAGMGIFEAFLGEHGHFVPPVQRRKAIYCWMGGMMKAFRNGSGVARHASMTRTLATLPRAVMSDVYARSDSWQVFRADLCTP